MPLPGLQVCEMPHPLLPLTSDSHLSLPPCLPCRTQDTKGVGLAEATHSNTTLWPDTTVVFSGAATMTTSCSLADTRDPTERGQARCSVTWWGRCGPEPARAPSDACRKQSPGPTELAGNQSPLSQSQNSLASDLAPEQSLGRPQQHHSSLLSPLTLNRERQALQVERLTWLEKSFQLKHCCDCVALSKSHSERATGSHVQKVMRG